MSNGLTVVLGFLWRWEVVTGAVAVFFTGGISAAYGEDFLLAKCLFFLSILWITAKTVTWSEVTGHKDRVWISIVTAMLALACLAGSMRLVQHRSEKPTTASNDGPKPEPTHTAVLETPTQMRSTVTSPNTPRPPKKMQVAPALASKTPQEPQIANPPPVKYAPGGLATSGNSGGFNIQQGTSGANSPIVNSPITVGEMPKDISPENMVATIEFLKEAPIKKRVGIITDQFTGAAPFPEKLYDALKDADWPVMGDRVANVVTISGGSRYKGAVIAIRGDPKDAVGTPYFYKDDPVAFIAKILDMARVPWAVEYRANLPEDVIQIRFIGGIPPN